MFLPNVKERFDTSKPTTLVKISKYSGQAELQNFIGVFSKAYRTISAADPVKQPNAQVQPKAKSIPTATANEAEPKPNSEALKRGGDASNAVENQPTPISKSTPVMLSIC